MRSGVVIVPIPTGNVDGSGPWWAWAVVGVVAVVVIAVAVAVIRDMRTWGKRR